MTRARDTANLIGSGNFSSTTFTATAGQTAFTISHTQGFVQVFMNGLLLDETADYTSNGTAITLTSGAAAGDEIEVVAYNTFNVGDAIAASGGTFTGAVTASNGLTVDDAGATPLTVDRATNNGDIIDIQKDGTSVGTIGVNSYSQFELSSSAALTLEQNSTTTKNLYFSDTTLSTFDGSQSGTVDLGRSAATWKDLYLSGGAYIGGTGAANHLDDYEEGTWTPYIGDLGGNNATMTTQNGKYIKIGSLVIANFGCEMSSKGSMTGNYTFIKGIPFNHTGSNAGTAMINRFNRLSGDISSLGMEIGGGIGSAAWFTDVAGLGATGDGYLSVSQINNNFFVQGTLVYTIV